MGIFISQPCRVKDLTVVPRRIYIMKKISSSKEAHGHSKSAYLNVKRF